MCNFLRYNFRMQRIYIFKFRCQINRSNTHRMYILNTQHFSILLTSYHIFIKKTNCQKINFLLAFKTCTNLNHPINHLSPILLAYRMSHKGIRTRTPNTSTIHPIGKPPKIINKLLRL